MLQKQLEMLCRWDNNFSSFIHLEFFKNLQDIIMLNKPQLPLLLSLKISMPKILLASSKSFISNPTSNSCFRICHNLSSSFLDIYITIIPWSWNQTSSCNQQTSYIIASSSVVNHKEISSINTPCLHLQFLTNPSGYVMYIVYSRSPWRKAIFTSSCCNSRSNWAARASKILIEQCFTTGENISLKSTYFLCVKPLATNLALNLILFSYVTSTFFL